MWALNLWIFIMSQFSIFLTKCTCSHEINAHDLRILMNFGRIINLENSRHIFDKVCTYALSKPIWIVSLNELWWMNDQSWRFPLYFWQNGTCVHEINAYELWILMNCERIINLVCMYALSECLWIMNLDELWTNNPSWIFPIYFWQNVHVCMH